MHQKQFGQVEDQNITGSGFKSGNDMMYIM